VRLRAGEKGTLFLSARPITIGSIDQRMIPSRTVTSHRPQLDALRAIAVSAVLVHHFLPVGRFIPEDFLTLGLLAVRLFFVLSGYLITGILLRSRRLGFRAALKQFYLRRALRIFPIYYLTLLAATLIGVSHVRQAIHWHLLYLTNVLVLIHPTLIGPTGHFWSLSVEEQFYFVWPFLILLTPYKYIFRLILIAVAAGLCWKTFIAFTLGSNLAGAILTPACLDSLGVGGLLAFIESDETLKIHRDRFLRFALIAGWVIVSIQTAAYLTNHALRYFWATSYLGVSLIFIWLVASAAQGFKGKLGDILEWRPILFVGKISYGLYLYHSFMPGLVRYFADSLRLRQPGTLLMFVCASSLTFLIAVASWYLIENPINRWKDKLRYGTEKRGMVAQTAEVPSS